MRRKTAPVFIVRVRPEGAAAATRVDQSQKIIGLTFEDNDKKADKLTLKVDNWDLSAFDNPIWRKGNLLEFSFGYPGNMSPMREAVIKEVKGALQLDVVAHAKSMLMHNVKRSRTFENATRGDIAKFIAEENGYGVEAQDIEYTDEVHPITTQARMTDAQFMMRLAALEGFQFYIDFDGFHFHRRRFDQAPLRVLHWYTPPRVGEILEGWSIENDITGKPGRVRLKGRDPITKQDIDVTGKVDKSAAPVRDVISDVDPETGEVDWAGRSFEKNNASSATLPTAQATEKSAQRLADAKHRSNLQSTIKMKVPLIGDPNLLAKSMVLVQGMGKRLSVRYYVKSVTHSLMGEYKMEAELRSDGHGGYAKDSKAGVKAEGKVNTADPVDAGKLEPKTIVDPETGGMRTIFVDTRGRSAGGGGSK